ncbi:MAG: phosphoglucosamine mutase [Clostridia bacterium]|nr:phosphoglucosamine mutase [Clostridia bacterium]
MGRLFGTDGIRGVANEKLTVELAVATGRAVAASLASGAKGTRTKKMILVGMDTRISSDMLANAISAGILSVGYDVINLGVVPTPAVAYLVRKYKARAGIMISASHNPYEFNGIKVFNSEGFKLADALEENVESMVLGEKSMPKCATGAGIGKLIHKPDALDEYIDFVCSSIEGDLDGLEVAFDCANGSSAATAKKLFTKLGVKCHMLSDAPDGVNINTNCGSTHLENLIAYVKKNKLSIGIAFDGDADRVLCVDSKGEVVDGDMIMAVMALDMKDRGTLRGNAVVGTVMSNFGFVKFCEQNGIRFEATKVGDRYVLEEMLLDNYCLGGEQSGHIIFKDYATTGDGQLSAVQLLSLIKRSGKTLYELRQVMTKYPQCIVNIRTTDAAKLAFYTDDDIKAILEDGAAKLGDTGRLLVRPSGTEPLIRVMTEGEDEAFTEAIAHQVAELIEEKLKQY